MFRLLSIEWLKLRGYRPFWVLLLIFMALLLLTNYVASHHFFVKMKLNPGFGPESDAVSLFTKAYSFPDVWDHVGFWVRVLGGLIPIFVIISTTNEFQYRTHRQNVIDGWSRAEFFHAKWLSCLLVAVVVTAYSAAVSLGFGYFYDPHPVLGTAHLDRLLFVFLLVFNYSALAMTLSFFLRRGALTVILFLIFCYVLEALAARILNWKFGPAHYGDYLPLQSSAGLLPFPVSEFFRKTVDLSGGPTTNTLAAVSVGWLVIYYLAGWAKLRKSDW